MELHKKWKANRWDGLKIINRTFFIGQISLRNRHFHIKHKNHIKYKKNVVLSSPVVKAPDEGEYCEMVEEGEVAGDDNSQLETCLNCPAQRRQSPEWCQQQPRRAKLYYVVHRRLESAARLPTHCKRHMEEGRQYLTK